jgi:hypothetical protein
MRCRERGRHPINGRGGGEVLGITIYSHGELERLLRGFNAAHNARRQRALDGKAPDQAVAERLNARRRLPRGKPEGRAGPDDIARARLVAEAARDVSQPDNSDLGSRCLEPAPAVRTSGRRGEVREQPAEDGAPHGGQARPRRRAAPARAQRSYSTLYMPSPPGTMRGRPPVPSAMVLGIAVS